MLCCAGLEAISSSCNWSYLGLVLPWWTSIKCCNLYIQGECCAFSSYDHVSLMFCLQNKGICLVLMLISLTSIHLHLSWAFLSIIKAVDTHPYTCILFWRIYTAYLCIKNNNIFLVHNWVTRVTRTYLQYWHHAHSSSYTFAHAMGLYTYILTLFHFLLHLSFYYCAICFQMEHLIAKGLYSFLLSVSVASFMFSSSSYARSFCNISPAN